MQESCPPFEIPDPSRMGERVDRFRDFVLGITLNFAALHPYLKMNGVSSTTPFATVVLPPVAHPRQDRVCKGINTETCQVKSQAVLMQ